MMHAGSGTLQTVPKNKNMYIAKVQNHGRNLCLCADNICSRLSKQLAIMIRSMAICIEFSCIFSFQPNNI
jgi:hypothetical protein